MNVASANWQQGAGVRSIVTATSLHCVATLTRILYTLQTGSATVPR